jgi:hypothetical protein
MVGLTLMNFVRTSVIRHFGLFESAVTLDPAVEEIGPRSFSDHTMATFTFPEPSRVRMIGAYAFANCGSLVWLTIPSSVKVIENAAFHDCRSPQAVRIATGSQLRLIGTQAFGKCSSMPPVDVPSDAEIQGRHRALAKVRHVDGSKRSRVQFLTRVMRG